MVCVKKGGYYNACYYKYSSFKLPKLIHCQAVPHFQDCPSTPEGTCKRCLQSEGWQGGYLHQTLQKEIMTPALPLPAHPSACKQGNSKLLLAPAVANGFCRYFCTASLNFCRTTTDTAQSFPPSSVHPSKSDRTLLAKGSFLAQIKFFPEFF